MPKFDFKGTNTNVATFKATAQVLENTGVDAYLGQATNIESPKILAAAGSIVTVEGRHAGVIGLLNDPTGNSITPDGPFDTPFTADMVLDGVAATGFIVADTPARCPDRSPSLGRGSRPILSRPFAQ